MRKHAPREWRFGVGRVVEVVLSVSVIVNLCLGLRCWCDVGDTSQFEEDAKRNSRHSRNQNAVRKSTARLGQRHRRPCWPQMAAASRPWRPCDA